jgi:ABC-type polysaccharide/polyol phosphate export permease
MLSFVLDLIAMIYGDFVTYWEIAHHLFMLISAIIFIVANLRLPQEASRYIEINSKGSQK